MIENEKHYAIDGWAILILIDVFKALQHAIVTQQKNYTSDEFLQHIARYDFVVRYLLNLVDTESSTPNTTIQDDVQQPLRDLLTNFNISVDDVNKRDESSNQLEK